MTTGAVLSSHGDGGFSQALYRGLFVREEVLCQPLSARPQNVDEGLAEQEETLPEDPSDREKLDHLTNKGDCASCHVLMNPIGYGFDTYDAIGRWRDVDSVGQEVVPAFTLEGNGAVLYNTDIDGDFASATELADALSKSETVRACYAKQWFRYATGRHESGADSVVLERAAETLTSTDDIEEMLITLATSDAFLKRFIE